MRKIWPSVQLGDLLQRSEEIVAPAPHTEYREVRVRLWGKGVVERGRVSGSSLVGSRRFLARAGQLIASRIDARNGALGVVPAELDGAVVTNDFPLFNVRTHRLVPSFLGWLTRTRTFVELCQRASEGTTNRVRLKEERFLALEIPLPQLAEQQRVVARIEKLAAHIHEVRTLRQQAGEEVEVLLASSSRDRLRATGAAVWSSARIEDVCEEMIDYRGRTPPISIVGIPHITSANIKDGRINWETNKFVSEGTYATFMTRGLPRPHDVLFTMEAPLGEVAVVPDERRFSLAQRLILLRPKLHILSGMFLAKALRSPAVRDDILSKATVTTVAGIASKHLKEVRVPVPPLTEQHRIVAELDALQAEADALKRLQAEIAAELDALLPAILDRAFKGEL